MNGGRFEFDDGGSYCGGWEDAKAHGHGVCTGPAGKGEYTGAWHYGFEVSGVYTWPSGNTYAGQWQNGKRHGLGVENRGRWVYKGDWTSGCKGRYGVRSSTTSQARYAGTWSANYHDGYGTEVYVDGGLYQGQWLRGMRHGFGIRKSAVHSTAARLRRTQNHASLTSLRSAHMVEDDGEPKNAMEGRGGFVLKASSRPVAKRRRSLSERSLAMKRSLLSGLRIKKQHSTGDIHQKVSNYTTGTAGSLRSSGSTMSCASDDSHGGKDTVEPDEEQIDDNATETYCGEWKNDARCGFGVCERSDGLKYHGEWANNMKNGYGITTFKDGTKEEGKYKNNVLVMSMKKKGVLFVRSSRLRDRIEASVEAATRSADIAKQKADIAASRTSTAKERSEQATHTAKQAKDDADMSRIHAKQFDPNFRQPGTEAIRRQQMVNSSDSPRAQLSSDHSSRSSQPPSFDNAGDMATDPLAYTNHVAPTQQQRLPHQISTTSSHMLHVNATQPQVSFDDGSFSPQSTNSAGSLPLQQNFVQNQYQQQQYTQQGPSSSYDHQNAYKSSTSSYPIPQDKQSISSMPIGNQHYQQSAFSTPTGLPPMGPSGSKMPQQAYNPQLQQQQYAGGMPDNKPPQFYRDSMLSNAPSTSTSTPKESIASQPQMEPKVQPPPSRNQEFQCSRISLADDHYEQYVVRSRRTARDDSKPRAPRELSNGVGLSRRSTLAGAHDRSPLQPLPSLRTLDTTTEAEDPLGSLPNLAALEENGVRMRREEAARLASNRRQQMVREEEDRELLRANPLRYLLQPSFRNLLRRWKVPILLVVANLTLLLLFYSLVTYEKKKASKRA